MSCLYILDITPISQITGKYFSQAVGFLFVLLTNFLCCAKAFRLN